MLVLLAGCAGSEYRDNAAQIASDPRCMDKPSNPDAEPAPWCKQKVEVTSSSSSSEVDFSGKQDKPR
jgi:hypothetical protein